MKTPTSRHGLTFDELRAGNVERLPLFKDATGRPAHTEADGSDWSPSDWTNALAGEAGEAANITKKIRRGDYALDDRPAEFGGLTVREALGKELADVVCYADLAALRCRIDLGDAVTEKFNEVSGRIGVDVELPGYRVGAAAATMISAMPREKLEQALALEMADGIKLRAEIAEWKRRAARHGCDTDRGDGDCA